MTAPSKEQSGEATTPEILDFQGQLAAFRTQLDVYLRNWMVQRKKRAIDVATESVDLVECVEILIRSGGKRIRPAIVWHTHQACGGRHQESAWYLALACELLHSYLLVHDDIMDHAEQRRGTETPHARFARIHRLNGWHGDPEAYGRSVAIMVGDLAWSWAAECADRAFTALDEGAASKLSALFFGMSEEVIWGQHLEMRAAARRIAIGEDLARILRLKSGLYSVQRPIQLGARLANAPEDLRNDLARYGSALGEAFQLQDDLLGMFGDPGTVGKPVGGDLQEGKFTFLIHHGLHLASESDQQLIRERLGNEALTDSELEETCGILSKCGARDAVREMISSRLDVATESLTKVVGQLTPEGRTFFEGLVAYLGDRDR